MVVESELIVTSSEEAIHPPFAVVIVHRRVDEPPMVKPVTPDNGSLMLVTTAVPEITDQVPVSLPAGVLAARVAVVVLQRF